MSETTPDAEVSVPEHLPLSDDLENKLAEIREKSRLSEKTQMGLRYLLAGFTYREAAEKAGLSSPGGISDAARRWGLTGHIASSDRLVTVAREAAHKAWLVIIERLADPDELSEMTARDLNEIATKAAQVVSSRERWAQAEEPGATFVSMLERVAGELMEQGVSLSASVSVTPNAPGPPDDVSVHGISVHSTSGEGVSVHGSQVIDVEVE